MSLESFLILSSYIFMVSSIFLIFFLLHHISLRHAIKLTSWAKYGEKRFFFWWAFYDKKYTSYTARTNISSINS